MKVTLYSFSKKHNSTKRPSGGGKVIDVSLIEGCNLYSPLFRINQPPWSYNYLEFNGMYFWIESKTPVYNGLYEITCTFDYLATYKTSIQNTRAYVAYSASRYDDRIIDGRLSSVDHASYEYSTAQIIKNPAENMTVYGTYVIEYVTSSATFGTGGCVWMIPSSARVLASSLSSKGFTDWLENNAKQLQGAYDSILSCRYLPIQLVSQQNVDVILGGYDIGVKGTSVENIEFETNISIPWQFSDFRNLSPYTSLVLYLPAYGYVSLNPADFIDRTSIPIKAAIDGVTGECVYMVGRNIRCSTNISTPVSIGTVANNAGAIFSSIGGIVGGIATANPAAAIGSAIEGIFASQERQLGNVGSASGGAVIRCGFPDAHWSNAVIVSICHDTNQPPSAIASTQGRPLNKTVLLSDLSGYVQTVNASVSAATTAEQLSNLNAALDGGIYLE